MDMAAAEYMRKKETKKEGKKVRKAICKLVPRWGYMHPRARSLRYKMTLHEYKGFSFKFYDFGNLTQWTGIRL
jgi:hypothetical protein